MELEWQQLDLRYEGLRRREAGRERRLMASLAEVGQLLPVVVVKSETAGQYALVDGYKRVRVAKRLHWDAISATVWELSEADALLLEQLMRTTEPSSALEQGWLLQELRDRFGLAQLELAQRFDRSQSWVSRRLSLVSEVPAELQEQVRSGAVSAHAAMKYLAPMARAMPEDCARLAAAIGRLRLSSRQVGELYAGWSRGSPNTRERLLRDPQLYLRAQAESRRADASALSPLEQLREALGAIGGIARKARRQLEGGLLGQLGPAEREEVRRSFRQAQSDMAALATHFEEEQKDAGSVATDSGLRTR